MERRSLHGFLAVCRWRYGEFSARADMKLHFEALTKEGYDREIWRHKLAPLYDIMHAHWLKEEETKIPFGPEYFSKNEWEDFGKRFDEIVAEYLKKHRSRALQTPLYREIRTRAEESPH